jgi:hypothetical protein
MEPADLSDGKAITISRASPQGTPAADASGRPVSIP